MRFQTLSEGRWIFVVLFAITALGWWFGLIWITVLAALLIVFCL